MSYSPGPANAQLRKEDWTIILVRDLRHPPEKVWKALTDPAELSQWAPFDASRSLGAVGDVTLTTFGAPGPHVTETAVTLADAPHVLEYKWGGGEIRWELEPSGTGTRLTLSAQIDKAYVAMGAAGWHVCLDVLDHLLLGEPVGRIAGPEAMKFEGWQRLNGEYRELFGVEAPKWG